MYSVMESKYSEASCSLCRYSFTSIILWMFLRSIPNPPKAIYSIDPLVDESNKIINVIGSPKILIFKGISQNFEIPPPMNQNMSDLSIVVSCHSHAPLQEFWDRLKGRSLSVSMPCCSNFGYRFLTLSDFVAA